MAEMLIPMLATKIAEQQKEIEKLRIENESLRTTLEGYRRDVRFDVD